MNKDLEMINRLRDTFERRIERFTKDRDAARSDGDKEFAARLDATIIAYRFAIDDIDDIIKEEIATQEAELQEMYNEEFGQDKN